MAQTLDSYVAERERAKQIGPGVPADLKRISQTAFDHFMALGFPTTHQEEWRFTSVAPIAERAFAVAPEPRTNSLDFSLAGLRLPDEAAAELVFVDGHYVAGLSRISTANLQVRPTSADLKVRTTDVRVESLADAFASGHHGIKAHLARVAPFEGNPFVALNTAFLSEGAYVEVPAGTVLQQPIHLLFVASGRTGGNGRPETMAHPRVLAVLGPNSQATILETYAGPDGASYFTNTVTEIILGENAVLDHYTLQYEGAAAAHIGAIYAKAQRSANCTLHAINVGGALVRNEVVTRLDGAGIDCTLNGLYLADEQRLVDNHTTIDHAQPHCASREIYKGILADRAHGVFNGKIIVRPDAQKTDAKQTNRALLLSEDAQINTKPQLEIFANDVKCTHGAAVGQLDDEALFYLRSRGLGEAHARQLLIHAFAADVLNRLPLITVRAGVEDRLQRHLGAKLRAA
jgi:Fe-S cluster assembly protein SufD